MDGFERHDMDIRWPIEIEQYERKIYDLKQLIEISKGLNSTLDYNTLIDSILLTSMGQMQLLNAGIFLHKGIGADRFVLHRNYKGFEIDHSMEYEISEASGIVTVIRNTPKCYTLAELRNEVRDHESIDILEKLEPSLIVPLVGKGRLNGIIVLGERINKKFFSESEKEYMLNIASLAGIAIQNAYLYEMATTDMMTGLKIHHYFQTILLDELDRARRFNKPLALIMLDIDNFKSFNDTYGHTAGDAVLKSVASVIKENIRQMDIPARYGGEEFAVILPRTEIDEAVPVAERICESIAEHSLDYDGKNLSVTVSVGVAFFDADRDASSNDFINRADAALYKSKENGKNQVTVA